MKECPFFNFLLENSKRKKKNCSFVYQEEFVCPDSGFLEITFQTFLCLFVIKKVGQRKKFGLIFRKVFSFYFGRKTLFRSGEKIKNIILFADYIKFGPQTFD